MKKRHAELKIAFYASSPTAWGWRETEVYCVVYCGSFFSRFTTTEPQEFKEGSFVLENPTFRICEQPSRKMFLKKTFDRIKR
jgi:hypothetical protein